ncbi:MAG: penicillin binding protein, partial [Tardiphaga sp.]|nr:penicillin binding protein [Tardiphaga sp.]
RAALDGIPTAGKTGTTNAYRDAWFVGYTGNFTCAVWYGNDDYSPTNRMTGGSLPAQTWHDIMAVAHQGIEIKDVPGITPAPKSATAPAAVASNAPEVQPGPPPILTRRGADILVRVEKMLDEASKSSGKTSGADPAPVGPAPKSSSSSALAFPDSFASAVPGAPAPAPQKK